MSGAIAIFVKTPGYSPLKTRLAVQLGQTLAETFHLKSAHAVSAVVQAANHHGLLECYYAVAEQAALQHHYWIALPCLWQGQGGLGERMALIYQTLLNKHEFVILVGADSPQMTVDVLSIASSSLFTKPDHMVFGPSVDGGFWLFGGNCTISPEAWINVKYSAADTGAQFLKNVQCYGNVTTIKKLIDVDEPTDLPVLQQALQALPNPLAEQLELMRFLERLPISLSNDEITTTHA